MLHLVRHGRPLQVRGVAAEHWELDPAGFDDVWALRDRLPAGAAWYSSSEPKARQTAQLLTDGEVGVVDALCEHRRGADWIDDFEATVERAFAEPAVAAYDGWEPLAECRTRVTKAVSGILSAHASEDVVLVGHGTAWTVLASDLTGAPPDLVRWRGLGFPDVFTVDV
ncbi:histidine phosphatase family protein [Nocardioides sp. NPDC057767]|uniref:histidine phosphatase family protein n=1 Tax=unclassified Nocardioides TaxID=2615069 RepID=UPI0036713EDF